MASHKVSGAAASRSRPAPPKGAKVPVTERALLQRINRRLAHESRQLRVSRSDQWVETTGRLYVVDLATNSNVDYHVDAEALGRELGVLRDWEELRTEP